MQWIAAPSLHVVEGLPGVRISTFHLLQDMIAQMLEKGKCLMRVDGPYGVPGGPGWHKYDALVIIAGGIGSFPLHFDALKCLLPFSQIVTPLL